MADKPIKHISFDHQDLPNRPSMGIHRPDTMTTVVASKRIVE